MRQHGKAGQLGLGLLLFASASAEASVVAFDVTNLFGNTWEYAYTVENDSLGVDVEELEVYFDVASFENLRMPGAPAGWDPIVVQPDVALSDDGFYDALALAGGVPLGSVLGGFTVWADFVGAGAPGAQRFEIRDPLGFALLDSGLTVGAVGAVAEPASVFILGVGLLAIGALVRERRPR